MHFTVTTPVEQSAEEVYHNFTGDLLKQLSPPFPLVRILRNDGTRPGDRVHIQLDFLLFKQLWISEITDNDATGPQEFYFVDEGRQLPFFLGAWRHKHRIRRREKGGSEIIDDVTFRGPLPGTDWLIAPALYAQFVYRRPLYRRLFRAR
jgi:ligand-binding SRPBCC domain-containing protein